MSKMEALLKEVGAESVDDAFEIARAAINEAGREGAVEGVAKEICRLRGYNPYVRCREYGQSSFDYWTWELFRDEAKQAIDYVCGEQSEIDEALSHD